MFTDSVKEIDNNLFKINSQLIDIEDYSLDEIVNYIINNSSNQINFYWLGKIGYNDAWGIQKEIQEQVINNNLNDIVLFLEHDSVYTLGKNADMANLLPTKPADMDVVQTDRGGEITYHGPGQLIGYPIIDLKRHRRSITWFMRGLENSIIKMLKEMGISSSIKEGLTGVWVDDKKIAALGVRLSKWVSMHGFAINIYTDLTLFRGMVPCGISDFGLTSMLSLKNKKYNLSMIASLMISPLNDMLLNGRLDAKV